MEEKWRILEFFSGIGGMRYSLLRAGINGEVVQAFDINDTANDVYELNFGHRPFQGNIQSLTAFELDKYGADAWLLSPPCQPYTRQGLRKHSADARAFSFIKILELITQMLLPPKLLFVENVVGFETSDTHKQMLEIFGRIGFVTQEYILSPLQFGIPYSRPRYFCLAKRRPLSFQNPSYDNKLLLTAHPLISLENVKSMDGHLVQNHEQEEESHISCQPIKNFLEVETFFNHRGELGSFPANSESNIDSEDGIDDISGITDKNVDETEKSGVDKSPLDNYSVPQNLIERLGNVMDIVFPQSKRCCCFTKSYYRYVKGTGSLLATSEICKYESLQKLDIFSLKHAGLRYFTPREVANLHSFPEDFRFPPNISIRQQYALLGNSLSISVVASLFRYMFSPPT